MNAERVKALKPKYGDQAEFIVSVEEAVAAAGADRVARYTAGLTAIQTNAKGMKGKQLNQAIAQFPVAGFVDLCETGIPKA